MTLSVMTSKNFENDMKKLSRHYYWRAQHDSGNKLNELMENSENGKVNTSF